MPRPVEAHRMSKRKISRRAFIRTTAAALPLVAGGFGAAAASSGRAGEFVIVRDGRLELRGRRYACVGANLWYGCYAGDAAQSGGRQRLTRELDRLKAIGATNIRLLAGSETSQLAGAIPR